MKQNKKRIRIVLLICVVAVGLFLMIAGYLGSYYPAGKKAMVAMAGNEEVEVSKENPYYEFHSLKQESSSEKEGIIFYPGAKVDEKAYAPLMMKLAEAGYEVFLVKMPFHMAIFDINAADDIIADHDNITTWVLSGHSLGGAMAANYVAANPSQVDGLLLLAAYETKDISKSDITVVSIYGTKDKVLNQKNYQKYLDNLPTDYVEDVIIGGNHAGYADYGKQKGDGIATISKEEQEDAVLQEVKKIKF